jgi:hypothetical protein
MEQGAGIRNRILGPPLEGGITDDQPKDFFADPFSDNDSEPSTPMSEVSNYELSIQAIRKQPQDAKRSTVTCCRCDCVNSFEPESRGSATCEKCTRAFCRKCRVESEQIAAFDERGKAFITRDKNEVDYYWFCSSCGVKSGIPRHSVLKMGCVASVDVRFLSCGPCQQKANRKSLTIAFIKAKPISCGLDDGGGLNWHQPEFEAKNKTNFLPRYTTFVNNRSKNEKHQGRRNWVVRLRRWTF